MNQPFYFHAPIWLVSALLLAGILGCIAVGLRFNPARRGRPSHISNDNLVITSLFALMGLLLAFTFSAAASRFEKRREIIIEEANAIGTALLRTDLYPDTARTQLRNLFRQYIDLRVRFYESPHDLNDARRLHVAGAAKAQEIWEEAACFSKGGSNYFPSMQLVPALNQMIDLANTRAYNGLNRVPDTIIYFLFITLLISGFFIGYAVKEPAGFDWIAAFGFGLVISLVVFTLLDLDQPKSGLITTRQAHESIKDLQRQFSSQPATPSP